MDSIEFTEWRAFFALYPPIEERLDILIAAQSGTFPDYFAKYREPEEMPSEDQTADQVHAFFSHLSGLYTQPAT